MATSNAVACPRSDLPEPFCHAFIPYEVSGRIMGVVDQVREGVRPLLVYDEEQLRLRLVSPLDPNEVLLQGPPTIEIPPSRMLTGDFDGDGIEDFAFHDWFDPSEVIIVDGETLEYVTTLGERPSWGRMVGAVDVDGDGATEVITGEYEDDAITLNAWRLDDDEFTLVQSRATGVECPIAGPVHGDFNGDGKADLAFAWLVDCEFYLDAFGLPRQITTLLGATSPTDDMVLTYSDQPIWAHPEGVSGDLDGDGDDEFVIASDIHQILIMDWSGSGFVEDERLSAPMEYSPETLSIPLVGNFANRGLGGGVFLSGLRMPGDNPFSGTRPNGALFRSGVSPQFVLTTPRVSGAWLAADFNADGVVDFRSTLDDEPGMFVSAWSP